MRRMTRLPLALLPLGLLPPPAAEAQEYYADIRPLLTENCVGCHSDAGIAFSMEDPEETYERRGRIGRMVAAGRMPPWLAEAGHQDYRGDRSLSPDEIALVARWVEAGYPLGEALPDPEPAQAAARFEPDLGVEVLPGIAYTPEPSRADDYRCFVVDWPRQEDGYVTGFRTVPGNLDVAHHTVVFAVAPGMADRFRELADAEEGEGYQCFGGAVPDRLGDRVERDAYEARYPDGVRELDENNFWLAHWAPGMYGHAFPEGTGIRVEPGSALVVQMHYYSGDAPGESDRDTRVEFQVAPDVDRPAFHLPLTRNAWLNSEENGSMVVPAGGFATYAVRDELERLVPYVSEVTGVDTARIEGLEIHSANLHMHAFGHSGEVTLTDSEGRREILLAIPRWNLHWQQDFTFARPKVLARDGLEGAYLEVECTYRNPGDEPVYGGFGSYDEMCFNFSYVAVRARSTAAATQGGDDRPRPGGTPRPGAIPSNPGGR